MWPTIVLSSFFPSRNYCAENFKTFFYEIKFLFTYLPTSCNEFYILMLVGELADFASSYYHSLHSILYVARIRIPPCEIDVGGF